MSGTRNRQWNAVDLTGQRFGKLTAVARTGEKYGTNAIWLCRCDCGGSKVVNTAELRKALSGRGTRSCGCLAGRAKAIPVSESEASTIIFQYHCGLSGRQIAEEHGISHDTVLKTLRTAGVQIRHLRERRLPLDETVFDAVNEHSAYWLGFLFADGYVGHSNCVHAPCLKVRLAHKDVAHLQKLRYFLRSGHAIGKSRPSGFGNYPRCTIAIPSKRLCIALEDFGLHGGGVYRFTSDKRLLSSRDFWRGVVDGDGSVLLVPRRRKHSTSTQPVLQLVGNERTIRGFLGYCRTVVPWSKTEGGKLPNEKYLWRVTYKARSARLIITALYSGASTYLERKKETADRIMAGDFYTRKLPDIPKAA